MNRREFLATTTATLAAGTACSQVPTEMAPSSSAVTVDLRTAAANAWLWGLPLIEAAEQRAARFSEGIQPNTFQHQRALVTAKGQQFTTPNNDTLYSQAWLALENGPVTISAPASGERYYCVPLMDMYTNNFAIVGTRTSGSSARTFTVIGPNENAHVPQAIRAPTNSVWVLGRTLVDGETDLAAAHVFQDGWTINGPEASGPLTYVKRTAPWNEYFSAVQVLMNENPPNATHARMLERIAPLLQLGQTFDPSRFSPAQIAHIQSGIADARVRLQQVGRDTLVRNGWSFPRYSLGDFGQDYDYRAAVAVGGLAALPRVEAMYLRAGGPDGRGFDGARTWRLTFAAHQLPPADSFWSLSMYRLMPDGRLYFAENPIDRYVIGDRTPGLKRGADGSLDIVMSRTEPTAAPDANWLPSPASGNFVPILRAYRPRSALLEGTYEIPQIQLMA